MLIEDVKDLTPVERFVYWITERESIRIKKDAGYPKPWTDDKILRSYRFCNVVRMDDKVSRWLLYNWYLPNKDHPNIVPACALARFINLPESLELIGFPRVWDRAYVRDSKEALGNIWYNGGTVFNSAYIIRGNCGEDKITSVFNTYTQPLVSNPPKVDKNSFRRTHGALLPYFGFGSFVAGQVTADLRHCMTGGWKDVLQWAPLGPGSKRGMNRVMDRDLNASLNQSNFTAELRSLIEIVSAQIPSSLAGRMEAMDFQNCLCEVDKYNRALFGEGSPKSRYPGV